MSGSLPRVVFFSGLFVSGHFEGLLFLFILVGNDSAFLPDIPANFVVIP
ncbi:MAG: hypothetical protein SOX97_03835 [Sutterella sp.]|nr:hypothetical protein [Sutterella sp.]